MSAGVITLYASAGGCKFFERIVPGGRSSWKVADPGVVLYRSGEGGWFREGRDWRHHIAEFLDEEAVLEQYTGKPQMTHGRNGQPDEVVAGTEDYGKGIAAVRKVAVDGANDAPSRREVERLIRIDMSMIERYQAAYESSLYIRIAQGEFLFDVGQLGLSFASTVSGGEATKTVLSAVATFVGGARLSLRSEFLQDQTSIALIKIMQSNRDEAQRVLIENLANDTYESYAAAESDLIAYFVSGSLVSAIAKLDEAAAQLASASSVALAKARAADSPLAQQIQNAITQWVEQGPEAPTDKNDTKAKRLDRLVQLVSVRSSSVRDADADENVDDSVAGFLALEYITAQERTVQELKSIALAEEIPIPEVSTATVEERESAVRDEILKLIGDDDTTKYQNLAEAINEAFQGESILGNDSAKHAD
ncbi:MAG: hypothetical protein AAFY15_11830, partial [Cyanobacteria bacterium J06648_11]